MVAATTRLKTGALMGLGGARSARLRRRAARRTRRRSRRFGEELGIGLQMLDDLRRHARVLARRDKGARGSARRPADLAVGLAGADRAGQLDASRGCSSARRHLGGPRRRARPAADGPSRARGRRTRQRGRTRARSPLDGALAGAGGVSDLGRRSTRVAAELRRLEASMVDRSADSAIDPRRSRAPP